MPLVILKMEWSERSGQRTSSTDFSIDRILSEEPRRPTESPGWLCCTRYRPPRLPRSSPGSRSRRAGRHARVPFTATQAAALESAYSRAPYLAPPALRALAAALQLRDDRIKIWFQNRRARDRRERGNNITPPQAMTLSSTCDSNPFITNLISAPVAVEHCCLANHTKSSETPENLHSNTVRSNLSGETSKERMDSNSEDSESESLLNVEIIDD